MGDLDEIERRIRSGENVRSVTRDLPDDQLVGLVERPISGRARWTVFDILGEKRVGAAVNLLVEGLRDPDSGLRASAADALGKIGDRSSGRALLAALASENDDGVRRGMLAALYTTGDCDAIPALRLYLRHPDPGHRAFAARSLGGLGAVVALPELEQVLADEYHSFARQELVEAVRVLRPAPAPLSALLVELADPRPAVRAAAATSIAERGDVAAIDAIEAACATEADRPTLDVLNTAFERLVKAAKRR